MQQIYDEKDGSMKVIGPIDEIMGFTEILDIVE